MMRMANLHTISYKDYVKLINSGMFWELFPDATGKFDVDMKLAQIDFKKVNP